MRGNCPRCRRTADMLPAVCAEYNMHHDPARNRDIKATSGNNPSRRFQCGGKIPSYWNRRDQFFFRAVPHGTARLGASRSGRWNLQKRGVRFTYQLRLRSLNFTAFLGTEERVGYVLY